MTELTRRTCIIGLCLASAAALAAGKTEATGSLARLKAFLKSTTSARGTFRQTVIDRSGREVSKPSSGYFRFMRPGRFEWTYEKPYVQRIMSDGKTLWIHDPELFQVTEKALEGALPSTPAAILFGERDFEEDWNVTEISDTVLEARPKNPDGSFESVVIEFDARGELAGMELVDTFAYHARLRGDRPRAHGSRLLQARDSRGHGRRQVRLLSTVGRAGKKRLSLSIGTGKPHRGSSVELIQ